MNANNTATYWRLGIRDAKNWNHWDWSPEFETFTACFNAYKSWIEQNPRRVITFATRTATIPTQNKGAQQ
jgi:hypothetical protein